MVAAFISIKVIIDTISECTLIFCNLHICILLEFRLKAGDCAERRRQGRIAQKVCVGFWYTF
jgi:hypothetical protein